MLDQTTRANMSSSCAPAARLAITLPAAHPRAPTMTKRNPAKVPASPVPRLWAPSKTKPAAEIPPDQVMGVDALVQKNDAQSDGEEHLQLDHQRRKPRRHAELHPKEKQPEMAYADGEAVAGDIAPRHLWPPYEKHERNGGEKKAQRPHRERRHLAQTHLDRYEGKASQRDDSQGQRQVAQRKMRFQSTSFPRRRKCRIVSISR